MSEADHPEPKYGLGQVVVVKSYPGKTVSSGVPGVETTSDYFLEQQGSAFIIQGDPLHVPPMMVVTGIEIEDGKKRTHDLELGVKIADRIKYEVMWFDNKKSAFVKKVLYETLLSDNIDDHPLPAFNTDIEFEYGKVCAFVTEALEVEKVKETKTKAQSSSYDLDVEDSESRSNLRDQIRREALLTFVCPFLVMIGIAKNKEAAKFDEKGRVKCVSSDTMIKVMWFNYQQQKYSEIELPKECLILID